MGWIIVGCGFTGTVLARRLATAGEHVTITRRDADVARAQAAALGVHAARVDLADPASLAALDVAGAAVVLLAPPGADPSGELTNVVERWRAARRFVYVSSTGVYGRGNGAWVDETWPLAPLTPSGQARVAAESALVGARSAIALRAAGIYGPGRSIVDRIRAGAYRIVGDGRAHVSRIHVDDLVEAIVRAAGSELAGPVNIADDDPSPIGEVADAIAASVGMPPPPRVPVDSVAPEVAGMLTADRRIANGRMKRELGVVLRVPSWRAGLSTASTQ